MLRPRLGPKTVAHTLREHAQSKRISRFHQSHFKRQESASFSSAKASLGRYTGGALCLHVAVFQSDSLGKRSCGTEKPMWSRMSAMITNAFNTKIFMSLELVHWLINNLQNKTTYGKKQIGTREKEACVDIHAHASASQICLQKHLPQQQNSPMADSTFGSKSGPHNGAQAIPKRRNENVTQFWTPFWGPSLDPKVGSAIGEFRCCPQMFLQTDCNPAAWTWISTHTFFSLCVPSPVAGVKETNWDAQREKACVNTHAHAAKSVNLVWTI